MNNETFKVSGIGTFQKVLSKGRTIKTPMCDNPIKKNEYYTVKFKASDSLLKSLNDGSLNKSNSNCLDTNYSVSYNMCIGNVLSSYEKEVLN